MLEENGLRYVTDELGRRHSRCHGVPAREWFDRIRRMAVQMSKPVFRERYGIVRLTQQSLACNDADCKRLNRSTSAKVALFYLSRDLEPIRPINPADTYECSHVAGHPWKAGSCICWKCAIVTMTKRQIDEDRVK